jgi:hypothetical protein
MVKAADALSEAGYKVRVVSASFLKWAHEADQALLKNRPWKSAIFDYAKDAAPLNYLATGIQHRVTKMGARLLPRALTPLWLAAAANSRAHRQLLRMATSEPADLFYASTSSLPVAYQAGRVQKVPFALDFEDLYTAEQEDTAEGRFIQQLIKRIEIEIVPKAAFVTTACRGITAHLCEVYSGVAAETLLNVFPLSQRPRQQPSLRSDNRLLLYWCSQTIGRGRGLEDAIQAIVTLPRGMVELHLRGRWHPGYEEFLRQMWERAQLNPGHLIAHPPAAPDSLVRLAAEYDVGLALEEPVSKGREICMTDLSTNKVHTYLLAGIAIAASSLTDGGVIFGGAGFSYRTGDSLALSRGLRGWLNDRAALKVAREKAWGLGETCYNWDLEKEKLLRVVDTVLSD